MLLTAPSNAKPLYYHPVSPVSHNPSQLHHSLPLPCCIVFQSQFHTPVAFRPNHIPQLYLAGRLARSNHTHATTPIYLTATSASNHTPLSPPIYRVLPCNLPHSHIYHLPYNHTNLPHSHIYHLPYNHTNLPHSHIYHLPYNHTNLPHSHIYHLPYNHTNLPPAPMYTIHTRVYTGQNTNQLSSETHLPPNHPAPIRLRLR
jgi:hypothetical protein